MTQSTRVSRYHVVGSPPPNYEALIGAIVGGKSVRRQGYYRDNAAVRSIVMEFCKTDKTMSRGAADDVVRFLKDYGVLLLSSGEGLYPDPRVGSRLISAIKRGKDMNPITPEEAERALVRVKAALKKKDKKSEGAGVSVTSPTLVAVRPVKVEDAPVPVVPTRAPETDDATSTTPPEEEGQKGEVMEKTRITHKVCMNTIEYYCFLQIKEQAKAVSMDKHDRIGLPESDNDLLQVLDLNSQCPYSVDQVRGAVGSLIDAGFLEFVGKSGNGRGAFRMLPLADQTEIVDIGDERMVCPTNRAYYELALHMIGAGWKSLEAFLNDPVVPLDDALELWLQSQTVVAPDAVHPQTLRVKVVNLPPDPARKLTDEERKRDIHNRWGVIHRIVDGEEAWYVPALPGFFRVEIFPQEGVIRRINRNKKGDAKAVLPLSAKPTSPVRETKPEVVTPPPSPTPAPTVVPAPVPVAQTTDPLRLLQAKWGRIARYDEAKEQVAALAEREKELEEQVTEADNLITRLEEQLRAAKERHAELVRQKSVVTAERTETLFSPEEVTEIEEDRKAFQRLGLF